MSREKAKEIVDYMVSEGTQNTNYGWNNHPLDYDLVYYTDFCHFEEA